MTKLTVVALVLLGACTQDLAPPDRVVAARAWTDCTLAYPTNVLECLPLSKHGPSMIVPCCWACWDRVSPTVEPVRQPTAEETICGLCGATTMSGIVVERETWPVPREPLKLREAVNVPDFITRETLVARLRDIRSGAVLDKLTIEHWNRMNPDQPTIDTTFEDAVIAWCDGKGPMPEAPR